jgi:hypothetical protein
MPSKMKLNLDAEPRSRNGINPLFGEAAVDLNHFGVNHF